MIHDKNRDKSTDSEDRSAADEAERKERVLHTRVPESLDDAIRAAASELGMSVSNLVRNVLANALEVVEAATLQVPRKAAAAAATVRGGTPGGVAGAGGAAGPSAQPTAARSGAADPAGAPEPEIEPRVLGWQEAVLNLNAVCDRCNEILPRGARAAIAIPERGASARAVRCLSCLEELTRDAR